MNSSDLMPVLVLLEVFVPLTLTGLILGSIGIVTYHRRVLHSQRLGSELIHEMLARDMPASEIQGVMFAWHQDEKLAKKLMEAHAPPLKKYSA